MIRTQIQFEENIYLRLKAEAAKRSCSISEVVRVGVQRELNLVKHDEKKEKALQAIGRFRSGLSDLAKNHDRYLDNEW